MDSEDKKYNVPGLDRALSIIELLNANPLGLSVNLIANRLNYPLNSVYRIMTTLERRKYVSKQSGESVFVLSEKLLKLATPVAGEPAFIEMALPKMRSLRDSSQETVLAGVLVGEEGVVLEQVEGLHSFSFRVNPGLRFPLHTAAPGKIFLSIGAEAANLNDRQTQACQVHFQDNYFKGRLGRGNTKGLGPRICHRLRRGNQGTSVHWSTGFRPKCKIGRFHLAGGAHQSITQEESARCGFDGDEKRR